MVTVLTPPLPDLTRWQHVLVPVERVPGFFDHRVVNPQGWWLDLGVSRPEPGEPIYRPFTLVFPSDNGAQSWSAKFTIIVTEIAAPPGRILDPTAKLLVEQLAAVKVVPRIEILEGVRAMMQFISNGVWDIEHFIILEPAIDLPRVPPLR